MIRIALVDKHRLFRKSIEIMLNSLGSMKVIFETESGTELLDKITSLAIDVILVDIQIDDAESISLCETLRQKHKKARVIALSQHPTRKLILKMIEIGVYGFFSKNSDPYQLKKAITTPDVGNFHYDTDMEMLVNQSLLWEKRNHYKSSNSTISITQREMDIVKLACKEYSSSEIADILNINVRTVETHRKRLMEKINTKNFIGVVIYVLKNRLLVLEE